MSTLKERRDKYYERMKIPSRPISGQRSGINSYIWLFIVLSMPSRSSFYRYNCIQDYFNGVKLERIARKGLEIS